MSRQRKAGTRGLFPPLCNTRSLPAGPCQGQTAARTTQPPVGFISPAKNKAKGCWRCMNKHCLQQHVLQISYRGEYFCLVTQFLYEARKWLIQTQPCCAERSCMACKCLPWAPILLQGTELQKGIWKHVPCQLSPGNEGQVTVQGFLQAAKSHASVSPSSVLAPGLQLVLWAKEQLQGLLPVDPKWIKSYPPYWSYSSGLKAVWCCHPSYTKIKQRARSALTSVIILLIVWRAAKWLWGTYICILLKFY